MDLANDSVVNKSALVKIICHGILFFAKNFINE
jgi:hypothetical protein